MRNNMGGRYTLTDYDTVTMQHALGSSETHQVNYHENGGLIDQYEPSNLSRPLRRANADIAGGTTA